MKFLKNVHDGMNVMPLNFLYHNERNYELDDAIDIIYKDMDSGEVIVETIEKPEIEVWVVKPEYRKYINTPMGFAIKYRYSNLLCCTICIGIFKRTSKETQCWIIRY